MWPPGALVTLPAANESGSRIRACTLFQACTAKAAARPALTRLEAARLLMVWEFPAAADSRRHCRRRPAHHPCLAGGAKRVGLVQRLREDLDRREGIDLDLNVWRPAGPAWLEAVFEAEQAGTRLSEIARCLRENRRFSSSRAGTGARRGAWFTLSLRWNRPLGGWP